MKPIESATSCDSRQWASVWCSTDRCRSTDWSRPSRKVSAASISKNLSAGVLIVNRSQRRRSTRRSTVGGRTVSVSSSLARTSPDRIYTSSRHLGTPMNTTPCPSERGVKVRKPISRNTMKASRMVGFFPSSHCISTHRLCYCSYVRTVDPTRSPRSAGDPPAR